MDRDLSQMANTVFPAQADSGALYEAAGQQRIVAALQQGIAENKHILCVTGPLGSGKTTLLRALRKRYTKGVVGLLEQPVSGKVLVQLTKSLQLDSSEANESFLRRQLAMLLSMADKLSHPIIQMVDGADALPKEELNLLLHFFPPGHATLIFSGVDSPEHWLAGCETSVGVARIDECFAMEAFSAEETASYIRHRLTTADLPDDLFRADQLAAIYQHTRGWPGDINRMCAEKLMQMDMHAPLGVTLPPEPEPEPVVESIPDVPREVPQEVRPPDIVATKVNVGLVRDPKSVVLSPPITPAKTSLTETVHPVSEPLPWRTQRLRRSVQLWRTATVLVSVLLAIVLLQDIWIDHSILERPVLGGLATLERDPIPLPDASSASSTDRPAIDLQADPSEPAIDFNQSTDFAALHPLASPQTLPEAPLSSAAAGGKASPQVAPLNPATESVQQFQGRGLETPRTDSNNEAAQLAEPATSAVKPEPVLTRAQRQEIARLYAERAEYEWRKGELNAAAASISNGLATDPRNPELLELRDLLREVDPNH